MDNPKSYVVCPICNARLRQINNLHLGKHGLDTKSFMKLYPTMYLQCEETRKLRGMSTSNSRLGVPLSELAVK